MNERVIHQYSRQSGWVLLYIVVMAGLILALTTVVQTSTLALENQVQMTSMNENNERLNHSALREIENGLRRLSVQPRVITSRTEPGQSADNSQWQILSNEVFLPANFVDTEPLMPDRELYWWEQPLEWWQAFAYKYEPPIAGPLLEHVHIIIIERGRDSDMFDISVNGADYSVDPRVIVYEIYVRSQTGDHAVRRSLSVFAKRFY